MLNNIRKAKSLLPSPTWIKICSKCESSSALQSQTSPPYYDESSKELKWQLCASVCILRPPFVCRPITEFEKQYRQLTQELEIENSLRCDHELRLLEDVARAKMGLDPSSEVDLLEKASLQTAAEFEDASNNELSKFDFESRITEEDITGDKTSLHRELERSLVLVTHKNSNSTHRNLTLPQTPWIPGESLKQTCERLIAEKCSKNLKIQLFGNAPCGFYKYKFSKDVRKNGFVGAKVFFFTGHVTNANLKVLREIKTEDLLWLTHEQLQENLNQSYHQAIRKFLILDM